MTDEQTNHFLTLLMGDCWHEWEYPVCGNPQCIHCHTYMWMAKGGKTEQTDHLANPLPVLRWMEKEMPEVWNLYLVLRLSKWTCNKAWETIDQILDLRNLVTYLVEDPEWGEKECPHVKADNAAVEITGKHLNLQPAVPNGEICAYCSGTGKIIHPALEYYLETKGEK